MNDDTLRAAFARERPYRPHWPERFEDAIADPIVARVLDILARHVPAYGRRHAARARVNWQGPVIVAPVPSACPTCAGSGWLALDVSSDSGVNVSTRTPCPACEPRRPRVLDRKSLAAGEREDED